MKFVDVAAALGAPKPKTITDFFKPKAKSSEPIASEQAVDSTRGGEVTDPARRTSAPAGVPVHGRPGAHGGALCPQRITAGALWTAV
jgi:hypothetical protein